MAAKSALDRAFPSWILLFACLAIALGLIAVLGWKIFALESERAEIERERLLLERDRDAFLTYGGELPQMTERHRRLTVEAEELSGRNKALAESAEQLTEKCSGLERKAARLTGAISELQAQLEALQNQAAEERALLAKLRPEQETAAREVALLKAQEQKLAQDIAQKEKQEAALAAKLEGLERSIGHNRDLLERMTADHAAYARFEKSLDVLGKQFEGLLARVSGYTDDYSGRLANMENFLAKMDQGLTVISADRQALGSSLDAIRKDRSTLAGLLKQNGEHNRALQAQVEAITANNRKFQTVMENVRGLDSRLQSAISAETASLRKMVQEDTQARASLAQSADTLAGTVQGVAGRLEAEEKRTGRLDLILEEQAARLKEMAALVQSLSLEVDENRSRGARLQALLAEIQNLLGSKLEQPEQER